LHEQDEKLFLANGAWQTAHRFGEFSRDFSLKFGESIVGEIELQIFLRTLCAGNFLLGAQRLVKLTPAERKTEEFVCL